MINEFYNDFSIKIDTSACKSIIADHDIKLNDTWYYSDQVFESGKIYGMFSQLYLFFFALIKERNVV